MRKELGSEGACRINVPKKLRKFFANLMMVRVLKFLMLIDPEY